ncbi:hypothetical protein [Rhodospirillum rubrum]|uniref:Uncharacterized protein n=1 Tax=Rhodospirillum rubrum (strain ATCC 11170 / ATH 1.1.1 / DSM 467 / LMG 4362 / NCIMB 8255 / S1) TaxID=269796 RepID=Q2RNV4_RHORT|nr:hypothetical protein [Rhodospirillum rubrum]ABC24191.1 hypothetical protein Rru_A3397 [Rhodospirillum rubrum ATCC 11170]AEO49942.1 hypothetical protein F11_17410 [Rhodospirillum rubrum F11]MBK5955909.1 hypothetical protein [Rhodospirillum rubrum]QXG80128.1 hypothetical protein KUL73_17545 [Rhodospirillum rubrum]HAQ00363.1 hypothetical protein [Rhodospirillum rubrum]
MNGYDETVDLMVQDPEVDEGDEICDDTPDRLRGLWEALAYLEQEAQSVGGAEVGVLVGCTRIALEKRCGGYPPPEPGRPDLLH